MLSEKNHLGLEEDELIRAREFDLYVSSQTCGYRKPNKKGLEYVAKYFGIDAAEILFVGDEKKDEDTAANAGCEFQYIKDYLKEWT